MLTAISLTSLSSQTRFLPFALICKSSLIHKQRRKTKKQARMLINTLKYKNSDHQLES